MHTDSDSLPRVADAGALVERDGVKLPVMHNGLLIEEGGYFGQWMTEILRSSHGVHEPQEEVVFASTGWIGAVVRSTGWSDRFWGAHPVDGRSGRL